MSSSNMLTDSNSFTIFRLLENLKIFTLTILLEPTFHGFLMQTKSQRGKVNLKKKTIILSMHSIHTQLYTLGGGEGA